MEVKQKVEPKVEVKPEVKPVAIKAVFLEIERNPSDWSLIPNGDAIIGTNTKTGKVFKGTISEFSAALKG